MPMNSTLSIVGEKSRVSNNVGGCASSKRSAQEK
jgi:hypothetical protein